ncbi:MAG: hypothetical protein PHT25_10575 [Bacteroidales bacterium]|nr:hypothetical protein [Bacteroidales bacterium]
MSPRMHSVLRKILIFSLLFSLNSTLSSAQKIKENSITAEGGVDFLNNYIWRGQDYLHKGSIQPYISTSWKNFTLGMWSALRINGDGTDEVDLYLSKSIGPVTLTIYDYWSYSKSSPSKYFDFNSNSTSHILETQVLISGGEKIPLNLLGSYMFYGDDPSRSVYLELQYVRPIKEAELTLSVGYQVKGEYYADKASFVNTSIGFVQPIRLFDKIATNLISNLTYNPSADKVYFTIGFGFNSL